MRSLPLGLAKIFLKWWAIVIIPNFKSLMLPLNNWLFGSLLILMLWAALYPVYLPRVLESVEGRHLVHCSICTHWSPLYGLLKVQWLLCAVLMNFYMLCIGKYLMLYSGGWSLKGVDVVILRWQWFRNSVSFTFSSLRLSWYDTQVSIFTSCC